MAAVKRIGPLFWYEFPASALGIYRSQTALRASEVAAALQPPPEALLDGPMFGGPHCAGPANTCFLLYERKAGLLELSEMPRAGMTLCVSDGVVSVASGAVVCRDADVAVQLYPALVRNGRSVASRSVDSERTWRAAVVMVDDTTLAFVLGQSLSMFEFAELLVRAGAREGGYSDGGLSTSLFSKSEGVRYGAANARAVPTWLVAHKHSRFPWVPVLTGASALAAALAAWWWSRKTG